MKTIREYILDELHIDPQDLDMIDCKVRRFSYAYIKNIKSQAVTHFNVKRMETRKECKAHVRMYRTFICSRL